ncbi:MAG: hypothetical protein O9301_08810 [Leptospira sp.]|nr:hypothetical protein [Leptospira sp.]
MMSKRLSLSIKIYIGLVLLIILVLKHTAAGLLEDSVYKYFQTIDFIESGYNGFHIFNHDYELDPKNDYGVFQPPFAHLIHGKVFMTFPWFWVLLNAPILQILGFIGIYLIPFASGILSVYVLYDLLCKLSDDEKLIEKTIYFYLFSTSLIVYSFSYYEGTICNLALFAFLNVQFKSNDSSSMRKKIYYLFISLVLLSMLVILRTEVFFLAILMGISISFVNISSFQKNFLNLFFLGLIPSLLFLFTNELIWSQPQGLRFLVTHTFTLSDRLIRILEYLVFSKHSLLLYIPTFFLTFILFKHFKALYSKPFFRFYLTSIIFIVAIPLVSPQQQGNDIIPRFYFPIIPFLAFTILYTIQYKFPSLEKLLTRLLFLQASILLIITVIVFVFMNYRMDRLYKKLTPYIKEYNVVSTVIYGMLVQNAERKNVYVATEEESAKKMTMLLKDKSISDYYLLLWALDENRFSKSYLDTEWKFVEKIEDITVYKKK